MGFGSSKPVVNTTPPAGREIPKSSGKSKNSKTNAKKENSKTKSQTKSSTSSKNSQKSSAPSENSLDEKSEILNSNPEANVKEEIMKSWVFCLIFSDFF